MKPSFGHWEEDTIPKFLPVSMICTKFFWLLGLPLVSWRGFNSPSISRTHYSSLTQTPLIIWSYVYHLGVKLNVSSWRVRIESQASGTLSILPAGHRHGRTHTHILDGDNWTSVKGHGFGWDFFTLWGTSTCIIFPKG